VGQGLMDDVPVEDIKRFEREMIDALRAMPSEALKTIKETGALDDDTAAKLKEEISSFKRNQWKGEEAPDSPKALAREAEQEEGAAEAEVAQAPAAVATDETGDELVEEAEAPEPEAGEAVAR
jgi:hypothetical protein